MSGQLSYNYHTPKGVAGSLFDISPYSIDSRVNGETAPGILAFGMGVMQGGNPGTDVLVPDVGFAPNKFEGISLTGFTNMMNMQGDVEIWPLQIVGVLRWGKCWARVADGVTPTYGEQLYLITAGNEAGMFTNVPTDGEAVGGRFIGGLGTGNIAPVEIFNQLNQ